MTSNSRGGSVFTLKALYIVSGVTYFCAALGFLASGPYSTLACSDTVALVPSSPDIGGLGRERRSSYLDRT